jgi:pSer/pThr/pTyr-binding forkhead associated (FHA) protein
LRSRLLPRPSALTPSLLAPQEACEYCVARRPIVNPNEGFWRCLLEFEKELTGERSGTYVPVKTKAIEDHEFELPPEWAAEPSLASAVLRVEKGGEVVDELDVNEHQMYTFGRSLTCDFQLEHPSASRQHAALVHHKNGGLYAIDLKSSHQTFVDEKPMRPYEAVMLKDGAGVRFGASSKLFRVGVSGGPGAAKPRWEDSDEERAPAPKGKDHFSIDATGAKRKVPHDFKRDKKKKKWLNGPKSSKRMTENEKIALMAGGGSGCMGPGFD